jgi:hypothetical protein
LSSGVAGLFLRLGLVEAVARQLSTREVGLVLRVARLSFLKVVGRVGGAGFLNTGGAVAGVLGCAAGLRSETKDQKVSERRLKSGMVSDMQRCDRGEERDW